MAEIASLTKEAVTNTKDEIMKGVDFVKGGVTNPSNRCGVLTRQDGTTHTITPEKECFIFTGVLVCLVAYKCVLDILTLVKSNTRENAFRLGIHATVGVLSIATMMSHCKSCRGFQGVTIVAVLCILGIVADSLLCQAFKDCKPP